MRAMLSASKSMGGNFPKASKRPQSKRLCNYFRDGGTCPYGAKCKFSHGSDWSRSETRSLTNRFAVLADLGDATSRDQMVAAVLRFYDSEHDGCQRMAALTGALSQALRTGTMLTVDTVTDLISEMSEVNQRGKVVGATVIDSAINSVPEASDNVISGSVANRKSPDVHRKSQQKFGEVTGSGQPKRPRPTCTIRKSHSPS